jgi:hypothetical protein
MGLTVAPGLLPLLFSLSMPDTTPTGQFGSLFRKVFLFTIVLCQLLREWKLGSPVWKGL